jgi:ABC-type cobalamin/Fe3+-siderophores transport system ATPase subunit
MKLTLTGLCAGYHGRQILDNVNASIETGEVVCLLGPNGSGKTTLFKAILGLLPSKGELCIDSKSLHEVSRRQRAMLLGYVPQIHIPPFPFTAFDVVLAGRTPALGAFSAPSQKDFNASMESLAMLNIEHLARRNYAQISGGERQLVLIARALAQSPRFLIMDEPTSHLDFGNQHKTVLMIRKLAGKDMGVIFTTHVPDQAFACASKVIALVDGKVEGYGAPHRALTPGLLNKMYGIDVDVVSLPHGGCTCAPSWKGESCSGQDFQ